MAESERVVRPGDQPGVIEKLDEVLLRLVEVASNVRPRCSCDGDPIECSHELGRAQAEMERDEARSQVVELGKRVEDLTSRLTEEIAWQKHAYRDGTDKVATGRTIGMEDALRTAREVLDSPAAQQDSPPAAPRVWQKGDPAPPHGTRLRTADGEQVLIRILGGDLWRDEKDPESFGSWPIWLAMAGPLTEILPEVPSVPEGVSEQ